MESADDIRKQDSDDSENAIDDAELHECVARLIKRYENALKRLAEH